MSNRHSLYFGYGSNLWLEQMKRRCPESKFIGFASLLDWKWIINARGYANIVPSPGDVVYGIMYDLTASDEDNLDLYEGVPRDYTKKTLTVDFVGDKVYSVVRDGKTVVDALVYVDVERMIESSPQHEYIHRMNMGMSDAVRKGIPEEYFIKYLRPFIPVDQKN